MKKILVLGAGKSSYYLLQYLAEQMIPLGYDIIACDRDPENLAQHAGNFSGLQTTVLDISDSGQLSEMIEGAELVVSLLPPAMHLVVAKICLVKGAHLATASYISPEMLELDAQSKAKGLVFLNECGLDPGIDHMSAMHMLDHIKSTGAEIISFESHCGGLVAEADCGDNPWKYKFSWNPMNVILAGQGGMARFRRDGIERYLPWHQLFHHTETLTVSGFGNFDVYPNRDSLKYETTYGLENADTVIRGTIRRPGFCKAWQGLVEAGYTDHTQVLPDYVNSIGMLSRILLGTGNPALGILNEGFAAPHYQTWYEFLKLDDDTPLTRQSSTCADLLRLHLEKIWRLEPSDRDEVMMVHRVKYLANGREFQQTATLKLTGKDSVHTAMAKTVGLPLGMAVRQILTGNIHSRGVCLPAGREWYAPILAELEKNGIFFTESGA